MAREKIQIKRINEQWRRLLCCRLERSDSTRHGQFSKSNKSKKKKKGDGSDKENGKKRRMAVANGDKSDRIATASLKIDSPIIRHIVHAFLDFLDSVQPILGVDFESLQVTKEYLAKVSKI
ncbi:hypothetical protein U1Q18_007007 [Sarracenia purpurea var. burkii]